MRRVVVFIPGVALGIAVLFGAYVWWDQRAYSEAVERDAGRRGLSPAEIQYPAHWPLDFYLSRLDSVADPRNAEEVVRDAKEIDYYILPVAGRSADSVLVQVFMFDVGRWDSAIQVTYRVGRVEVSGADWIPRRDALVPRDQALLWFGRHR